MTALAGRRGASTGWECRSASPRAVATWPTPPSTTPGPRRSTSSRDADRVASTYLDDSYVSRLGRGEIALDDCPGRGAEALGLGEQARVASDGAFDVRRPGPEGAAVLDPSGVVKGWAVQRAARALEQLDDTDWCLAAGGDMVCRTVLSGSPGWRIGIEDPHDPTKVVVPVRNGAVATSGLARRGAHITDPRTGTAPTAIASVTVIGPDLTWADIDATAAFVLGPDAEGWLTGRGRTGLVVWADTTTSVIGPGPRHEATQNNPSPAKDPNHS